MAAKLRKRIIRYGTKLPGQAAPRRRRAGMVWGGVILAGALLLAGILVIAQKSKSGRNLSMESSATVPVTRPDSPPLQAYRRLDASALWRVPAAGGAVATSSAWPTTMHMAAGIIRRSHLVGLFLIDGRPFGGRTAMCSAGC